MSLRKLIRPFLRYGVVYVLATLAILYVADPVLSPEFGNLVMMFTIAGAILGVFAYGAADQHLDTATSTGFVGGSGSTNPNNFRNASSEPMVLKLALYGLGASVIGFATLGVLAQLS